MAGDTAGLVRAAVQRLPASQRQVIELAYFEGLTCREVARAVGIPEGTAKSRLRLALAKLETVLDRNCWSHHDRPDRDPSELPTGLRERVLAASVRARQAGRPVPDAPEIPAERSVQPGGGRVLHGAARAWTRATGARRPCGAWTCRAWSVT